MGTVCSWSLISPWLEMGTELLEVGGEGRRCLIILVLTAG